MHKWTSLFLTGLLCAFVVAAEDSTYRKPPQPISDALAAPLTPIASVSPNNEYAVFLQPVRYPSIADVAQPMLRLAGIRIDINTDGMHLAPSFTRATLMRLSNGVELPLNLPAAAKLGSVVWSPDGQQFAFTNTTSHSIELWIANTRNGKCRRLEGIAINGVEPTAYNSSSAVQWLGDNRTLLARLVPAGRGAAPVEASVPSGPHVQESLGHAGPAPTFEDLLNTPRDEDLFDYYAASELAYIDAASGRVTRIGPPAIYSDVTASPDCKHLLVSVIHRPYSYQLPAGRFPQEIEVWDRAGKLEHKVASLPLADRIPIGGVHTGPREVEWIQSKSAELVWAEALDGGNPRESAPHRDRVLALAAPFSAQPTEIAFVKERFRGLTPLVDNRALIQDFERKSRVIRTLLINFDKPGAEPSVVFSRNERDAYHDPGRPMMRTLPDGRTVALQSGGDLYLAGLGASPNGDQPFLDRHNLASGRFQRLFQNTDQFEVVVAVLDDEGKHLLTRRESPTDPPNYFLRTTGANTNQVQLTHFVNPMPQAAGVKKQLVTYKRADGVSLSFTLYLPPDYKPGTRLPTLVWAYPYEFSDSSTASQVSGHQARSFPILNYHQLFVLNGYALLDNASMPIVGGPDEVNNTYVEQLQMDARAAIDKAVELGVTDRDRVGVFGHSYGAFMTMNLLAHTQLFHAGVAESGAYNRTLTPFGFQTEERTFWQASDVYTRMSPFWFADKIKTPVLMIHGEADDNTGTFPIQSERMYAALRGNGGTVRLVMLPNEAHGYRAIETMNDVLYEELTWFDQYLKASPQL